MSHQFYRDLCLRKFRYEFLLKDYNQIRVRKYVNRIITVIKLIFFSIMMDNTLKFIIDVS